MLPEIFFVFNDPDIVQLSGDIAGFCGDTLLLQNDIIRGSLVRLRTATICHSVLFLKACEEVAILGGDAGSLL